MMTLEQKTRLGIFLSVATVIFIVVAGFFIVPKLRDPGTDFMVRFKDTSVHGLAVGSPVKYRGVELGRVTRIEVSRTDLDCVDVGIKILPELVVKTDMRAVLVYVGLTGQKYIELSGGTAGAANLQAHGEIPTGRGLGDKADDIVNNIETTAKRITELLAPENIERFSAFLENAEKSSAAVSGVLESRRASLENTLASLEKASAEFARATERFVPMTDDLSRLVRTVEANSERTLGNVADRFSAEELGQVLKDVRSFLDTASVTMKKVEGVLLEQQTELTRTFASLGVAIENLARFSREIAEEPSAILRTRKDKK
ncbi:MAG: MCE family protein [Candidatus Aminicenantes bacterium]|nr:MCE family protein [Candidatus Aminicenantes bacterium]NLH76522.1 MCE family protein [Acidobacteriota bacterium]